MLCPRAYAKSSEDNTAASQAPYASQPVSASSGIDRLHYADRFLTHDLVRALAAGLDVREHLGLCMSQ